MLKLTYPRGDEDLEADVLAAWNGRGAVRLLDRDGQAAWTRLHQSASPVHQLCRQVQFFADAAGADPGRTIAWTQARALLAALRIGRSGQDDDQGLHQWVAEALLG